ncbi:hypothetical protein [Haloplanus halobius]|uniref:hypothetical protein n=1 Tax=Haloplanus halobius TaxID=2934938 RepID=UPI00200F1615|nr:hypothetical protein [Haloplanus sp. XH21]
MAAVYGHVVFVVGLESLFRVRGVIWTVITTFVIGPLYISVAVEAVLIYLSIHLLLPRRLANSDLGVHFFDPRQMGGFRPFGALLKRSYYLYTTGLLLYLTWIYGPILVPYEFVVVSEPGTVAAVFFTLLWLVGLATLSYSIYKVHQLMAREKEAKIQEIEAELHDTVDDPYDIGSAKISDREKFDEVQQRLDFVRSTSTYPTTFTMWTQILISVILPQIVQLSVQTTL